MVTLWVNSKAVIYDTIQLGGIFFACKLSFAFIPYKIRLMVQIPPSAF